MVIIHFLMPIIKKIIKRIKGTSFYNYLRKSLEEDYYTDNLDIIGQFTDKHGNNFFLLKKYRDYIKPNWMAMLNPAMKYYMPSINEVDSTISDARSSINLLMRLLEMYSISLAEKKVLEIGCYNGARTYALAEKEVMEVTGSDMPDYYIKQSPNSILSDVSKARQTEHLSSLRKLFYEKMTFEEEINTVKFIDDDICSSSLPSESFDLVCSWEVLEHIQNEESFFRQLHRILKVGGISFHEYNPFFAIDGGHSLCTLDFPWGHTRLDSDDFRRYVNEVRPDEAEVDISFYEYNLNRMTLYNLNKHIIGSGLELLALIPWANVIDVKKIDRDILLQSKINYPSLNLNDLIARTVWVIIRKP